MYKKSAIFTVTGENLDQGISASASGACTSLSEQPGGTAVSRSYTCVPQTVGPLNVTVSATTGGTVLKQANVTVPFPQVTLQTSKGTVIVELRPDKAPKTVDNFLQYVNDGFYDNTIFHRVISGFVVQGGGEGTDQVLKTTRAAIPLEAPATTGLSNIAGTIAMARTSVGLDTATSQFFINTVSNTALDTASGGYAVFGSVIQGMSVVKEIEAVPVVDTTNYVPATMITVTSARQTNTINVTLPAVPSGVLASGGANQASISWTAVPGATSYNVYWSTTPGVTITSGSKAKTTATAVSHRPLLANTTYYYIITAENSAGESAPSSQVSATTSTLDGVALYSANCASCHNALASSTKKGKTAAQIQAAITANTGNMGTLSTLTAAQIQAIANVL
jgi:cyclophilin family peptidyl-prolyl cis-trans isomerase/mono/diheme cytochrome c family protein